MKKLLTLTFFALTLFSCQKNNDVGYDKIELDDYIIENYSNDAKQLYMDEIFHDSTHANFTNSTLDKDEITNILKLIQCVYNTDTPERDTVFEVYSIHGRYCYSYHSVSLKVKSELAEIQNLANNVFPTGESSLDHLLTTYNFDSVKTMFSYPDNPWLTIYTKNEYNMIPIEKEFSDLESIIIAEFSKGYIGDGNTITLDRNEDSAIITFSIGSGDCPSGCIYHRYWEFKVTNGVAKFIKAY